MTRTGNNGSGDGVSGPTPGRRRPLTRDVADEVRALRDEVADYRATTRDTAGLLAENLPRLDTIEESLAGLRAALDALLNGGEDEQTTAARAAVGLSLQPATPWVWPVMDPAAAFDAWDQLGRWVAHILIPYYTPTLAELPECWPLHPQAVAELTWLRATYLDATRPKTPGHYAGDWHTRWRPAALANIAGCGDVTGAIDPERCWPGTHLQRGPTSGQPYGERDRARHAPCTPAHWSTNLDAAKATDLAGRHSPRADADNTNGDDEHRDGSAGLDAG